MVIIVEAVSTFIVLENSGLYALKPSLQALLRPLVRLIANSGIRANQVTVFACGLSVALGVVLLTVKNSHLFLLLPAVLLIRMCLNAMDGMLAREFGQASRLGIFLNELGDVVSDIFLYLPFAHVRGFSPFWIWNVVVLAVLTEMAGTVAAMAGATRRYDGPMGKSDRALVFGAIAIWVGSLGNVPVPVAGWVPKILVVLLIVTVINRVRRALHESTRTR